MKHTKRGSKYIGVYKCSKTNQYYVKYTRDRITYKTRFFKKETDAAKQYDEISLKYNPNIKYVNFKNSRKNIKSKIVKKKTYNKIVNSRKNIKSKIIKFTPKRPKLPEHIKVTVYSRQKNNCTLCKKTLDICRVVDHIIPRSLGGKDNINNYQCICGPCNKWKTFKFDHIFKNFIKKNKRFSLEKIKFFQNKYFKSFHEPYQR